MDTYYDDIIKNVEKLLKESSFQDAYKLLEEELSMPYIPQNIEDKLVDMYHKCRNELQLNTIKAYSEEDVDTLLCGNLEEQFLAIEQLKKSNIRNHFEAIQICLSSNVNAFVRAMLIEAMMEQNITDEFITNVEGLEVTFSPCAIEPPMEAEGVNEAIHYLREWFENDNPTFTMMCVETLVKEAYMRLPFNIDEEEGKAIASGIARYVFYAHEEYDAWDVFCSEKKLAQYEGYELLLSTHDIV